MTDEARVSKEGLILIPSKHGIIISFANGLRSVNPRTVQRPKDKNSLSPFSVSLHFHNPLSPFPGPRQAAENAAQKNSILQQ